jgi:hypothetical protein
LKAASEFYCDNRRRSGLQSHCKVCARSAIKRIATRDRAWHLIKGAKCRAKAAKVAFDLKRGDLTISDHCPVFDLPFDLTARGLAPFTPTIDRLDPHKGYTKNNVEVISWRANELKRNATLAEIEALCEWFQRALTHD